jgi:hypothetical protein
MKKRGIAQKIGLLSFILLVLSITFSCEKEAINKTSSEGGTIGNTTTTTTTTTTTGNTTVIPNTSFNPYGIWQRFGSPKGYKTDLAVGNIPGEPANRVYMCEHPGSPSEGLYKGYINGNIITWDSEFGLPNAEFKQVNNYMTLYFNVGLPEDAGKYARGIWTNTCGPLSKENTNENGSIGNVLFWTASDLGCGDIQVTIEGVTKTIDSYYSASPTCGSSGCANFTLPVGVYSYSASCSSYTWNGTISCTNNGCSKMQFIK